MRRSGKVKCSLAVQARVVNIDPPMSPYRMVASIDIKKSHSLKRHCVGQGFECQYSLSLEYFVARYIIRCYYHGRPPHSRDSGISNAYSEGNDSTSVEPEGYVVFKLNSPSCEEFQRR